jgi:hypothetical protein
VGAKPVLPTRLVFTISPERGHRGAGESIGGAYFTECGGPFLPVFQDSGLLPFFRFPHEALPPQRFAQNGIVQPPGRFKAGKQLPFVSRRDYQGKLKDKCISLESFHMSFCL